MTAADSAAQRPAVPAVPAIPEHMREELGINEFTNSFAHGFISVGRFFRQSMDASMDIGVIAFVIAGESVDYRARFLRCGCIVEIDQQFATNLALQNWKVFADLFDVQFIEILTHFLLPRTTGSGLRRYPNFIPTQFDFVSRHRQNRR